ncbi:MAG TPA: A/G-specific adenine glycosylase, partial [Paludibacteraceae bacterium]|nr:A/G-specific adenine glycosylase [Paludibacteraceae bacterium]HOL01022.1 A/G-specific adenine glycosylase [Paludibacteraceae bacterium]
EIILQQTRVNQGLDYYLRFVERFPNVEMLAAAEEDEVLKYWQGLGYYSRARNLHQAARQIIQDFGGVFPKTYPEVLRLKGVGTYTAAAICSFAYNLPYAVVDGNVYRVLSRLFAIETPIDSHSGKKEFDSLAQQLIENSAPSLHNQALMEFGALQCVPVSPDCSVCPLRVFCKAYELKMVERLPVKSKKTPTKQRFFNYLVINFNQYIFLQKRTADDIWKNLYEFPLIETDHLLTEAELFENDFFQKLFQSIKEISILQISKPVHHLLTHRRITAQFITLQIAKKSEALKQFIEIPNTEIDDFAVSRLMELYLKNEF